ncbi:MAG: hypothetical protein CUN53_21640, partial [Phototrophicales bacterium]
IMLSACAVAYVAIAAATAHAVSISPWVIALVPPLAAVATAGVLPRWAGVWAAAAAVRYLEVLIIAVRYYTAFDMIGAPIDWIGAFAFACVSVMASMIPVLSNGLG